MSGSLRLLPCLSDELEDRLLAFERAWEHRSGGDPPDLAQFRGSGADTAYLKELALIDLERRARAGLPFRVEDCLAALPELTDGGAVIDLLAAERDLRKRFAAGADLHDYRERFPTLARLLPAANDPDETATLPPGEGGTPLPPVSQVEMTASYEVVSAHARGGLGEVLVVEDTDLHRRVALKLLQARLAGEPRAVRDFVIEAEVTSRLEHPGIVPVHAAGRTADGRPCYSMRFVEGQTLRQAVRAFHANTQANAAERALAFRGLLGRFVAVCNTVAYAHSRGVIHRDIKPENIMLGRFGETIVLDWGLARTSDEQRSADEQPIRPSGALADSATLTGEVRGTLAYLSPEQARGGREPVGPAADIFGLGATLYVLLTDTAPYLEGDLEALLSRAREGDYRPPHLINREVPPALEAICLKAMAPKPQDRYPSALALAEDVENWLAGERVTAWREPWLATFRRAVRRKPAYAAAVAALAVVVPLAVAIGSYFVGQVRERSIAEQRAAVAIEQERAEAQRRSAELKERTARQLSDLLVKLFQTNDTLVLDGGAGLRQGFERGDKVTARQLLDRGAALVREQMKDQPLTQAALLETLGNSFRTLGLYDQAGKLLDESHRLHLAHLGAESAEAAGSLLHKGRLEHDRGNYAKAEELYRQALDLRRRRFGDDHLLTARVKFYLGWMLLHQPLLRSGADSKHAEESERLLTEVLATRRRHLPKGHRDIALAMTALAAIKFMRPHQRLAAVTLAMEAEAMFRASERFEVGEGSLIVEYLLAEQARNRGRYDQAIATFEKVLAFSRRHLEPDHPLIGMQLGNLAGTYRQMGDLVTAEHRIREALDIARRVPQRSLPVVVDGFKQLADMVATRDRKEAESLYREALRYAKERPEGNEKNIRAVEQKLDELLAGSR